MYIYKLFYTAKYIPKMENKYFTGQSKQVFAVEIDPEHYQEFMNSHYPIFSTNKVEQHIMTNYKFLNFLKNREKLELNILNINVSQYNGQKILNNENYNEFIDKVSKRKIDLAYPFLESLVEEGFVINKIECSIKKDVEYLRLNINSNGTISFSSSPNIIVDCIVNNLIIDYLVKGPTVLS